MAEIDYRNPQYYRNRELSWVDFDERCLSEARDKTLVPLFERLKFLSITASNLDEFYMVRVASLKDQVNANYTVPDLAGMTAKQQLAALSKRTHDFVKEQYTVWNRSLLPALEKEGLEIVSGYEALTKQQSDFLDRYFKENIYPVLTPMAMNTFSKMWGIRTPDEAKAKIREQIEDLHITEPKNLEEQALSLVGRDVYEKLIKGYTEKQWGRPCSELPAFIIRRIPLRFTYDNNYFRDPHQGIPKDGYTKMTERLLQGTEVRLRTEYREFIKANPGIAKKTVYTGMIDEFFDFRFGNLEYRSVRFEDEHPDTDNYQGCAVVNYTAAEIPWARIIEHKHFAFGEQPTTVISKEYPAEWKPGAEPYYPINNEKNNSLYEKYRQLSGERKDILFGGRLGTYKYYDMI